MDNSSEDKLTERNMMILRPLIEFYKNDYDNLKKLLDIIYYNSKNIPLRLIEWFVTNYAKKNATKYKIARGKKLEVFDVYRSYKAQLNGNRKNHFDPCKRGATIMLSFTDPTTGKDLLFETAYRQLNFFKWAIENLIIEYIEKHFMEIYTDMAANRKSRIAKSQISNDSYNGESDIESSASSTSIASSTATDSLSIISRKKTELSKAAYSTFSISNESEIEIL